MMPPRTRTGYAFTGNTAGIAFTSPENRSNFAPCRGHSTQRSSSSPSPSVPPSWVQTLSTAPQSPSAVCPTAKLRPSAPTTPTAPTGMSASSATGTNRLGALTGGSCGVELGDPADPRRERVEDGIPHLGIRETVDDALKELQSSGLLTLPSPAYIAGAILFGLVGMVAWRHGRKTGRPAPKWLGVALMLYPYAVPQTWLMYLIGAALCGWLWVKWN